MSRKRTKQYLMLLMVIGLVSVAAGGSGTFASFSAETTNAGNYFATGSLFLHNTHSGTTCTSESASTNLNDGTNGDTCSTLFGVTLGTSAAPTYATLTLKNTGTVNADGVKFDLATACATAIAYQSNTTLSGAVTANVTTAIPVNATTLYIRTGKHILITDGTNSDELVVSGNVAVGATTINVTVAPTHSYVSTNDVKSSAEFGTPDLCSILKFEVIETNDNTFTYGSPGDNATCAYPAAADPADGSGCNFADLSVDTLDNAPVGTPTALTLQSGIGGNAATGLDAGGTRYLVIGIKPTAAGFANSYQLRKATFDLVWHIDQA